jgi:hypothetical protein
LLGVKPSILNALPGNIDKQSICAVFIGCLAIVPTEVELGHNAANAARRHDGMCEQDHALEG